MNIAYGLRNTVKLEKLKKTRVGICQVQPNITTWGFFLQTSPAQYKNYKIMWAKKKQYKMYG